MGKTGKSKSDRCRGKESDRKERRLKKRGRQEGRWEEVVGTERQKVRGRGVLMAVCRAGLWGMLGVFLGGGQRDVGVCVCGWMDGCREV